jgi:rfaE bifunctional protein nucleotidyltransferase chain/domain
VNIKIFRDVEALVEILDRKKLNGDRLVLANGCFDILHVGHVRYLEDAARYGDIMVVAVNDDISTRQLKGFPRPIIPELERAEIISALSMVDYTLIFSGETVDQVILKLRPHIHAKGTDYNVGNVPELETSRRIGCKTIIAGDPKRHASSDIIAELSLNSGDKKSQDGESC